MVLEAKVHRRKVQQSSSNTHHFVQKQWRYKISQSHDAQDGTEQQQKLYIVKTSPALAGWQFNDLIGLFQF